MLKTFTVFPLVAVLCFGLAGCAQTDISKGAASVDEQEIEEISSLPTPSSTEQPYISVDAPVQSLFGKDVNVCFETDYREFTLTNLRLGAEVVSISPGNGWCGPSHSTGFGLLFRVKANQGHTIDFNLNNPVAGKPYANARDKTDASVPVWNRSFEEGQIETFFMGGHLFEVERLPDGERKEFRITLKS